MTAAHARFAVSAAIRALIDFICALGTAFVLGWHRAAAGSDRVQLTPVMSGFAVLLTCCLIFTASAATACDGPREVREATRAELEAFIRSKQMTVLTFTGYSGAQYEDPAALMEHASRVLDGQASAKTLINIGATAEPRRRVARQRKRDR